MAKKNLREWLRPRLRLWAIYNELGYIPWHKPRRKRKKREGVYMGARESIPFLNDDGKRTFSHLLFRPGYMMRDYILRGQQERYMAPLTALLVFYSVFTLLVAIVRPEDHQRSLADSIITGFDENQLMAEDYGDWNKIAKWAVATGVAFREAAVLTHLDKYPQEVDTPWKASLAAVEGDLRSKGIPLFLGNFLLLWATLAILLRKNGIGVSGAAAASAYILCQYCIFMFLTLLVTLGRHSDLVLWLMALLLFVDFRQMLGLRLKPALKLCLKTGILYCLFLGLFYALVGGVFFFFVYTRM